MRGHQSAPEIKTLDELLCLANKKDITAEEAKSFTTLTREEKNSLIRRAYSNYVEETKRRDEAEVKTPALRAVCDQWRWLIIVLAALEADTTAIEENERTRQENKPLGILAPKTKLQEGLAKLKTLDEQGGKLFKNLVKKNEGIFFPKILPPKDPQIQSKHEASWRDNFDRNSKNFKELHPAKMAGLKNSPGDLALFIQMGIDNFLKRFEKNDEMHRYLERISQGEFQYLLPIVIEYLLHPNALQDAQGFTDLLACHMRLFSGLGFMARFLPLYFDQPRVLERCISGEKLCGENSPLTLTVFYKLGLSTVEGDDWDWLYRNLHNPVVAEDLCRPVSPVDRGNFLEKNRQGEFFLEFCSEKISCLRALLVSDSTCLKILQVLKEQELCCKTDLPYAAEIFEFAKNRKHLQLGRDESRLLDALLCAMGEKSVEEQKTLGEKEKILEAVSENLQRLLAALVGNDVVLGDMISLNEQLGAWVQKLQPKKVLEKAPGSSLPMTTALINGTGHSEDDSASDSEGYLTPEE